MTWMITASGRKLEIAAIGAEDIEISDVSAHLAKLCRFTGACRIFWPVSEHSLLVERILAARCPGDIVLRLCGLLHDGTEYALQDLATPVKDHVGLLYRPLERAVWWAFSERFGLPREMPPEVKHADLVALATEKRDLMPFHAEPWSVLDGIEPWHERVGIPELHWRESQRRFLEKYQELQSLRGKRAAA